MIVGVSAARAKDVKAPRRVRAVACAFPAWGFAPPAWRAGQAMLESLLVLLVLVAGFLFFYDFAYGAVTRLLLNHAAGRVARADTVGFNEFHRAKALRVGLIPVSGRRLVPDGGRVVPDAAGELALVRTYLQSDSWADSRGVLDYERWDRLSHDVRHRDGLCEATVTFEVPELLPWKLGCLFGMESPTAGPAPSEPGWRPLRATWPIEDHASLYLRR